MKKPEIGYLLANPDRIAPHDVLQLHGCATKSVPYCVDKASGTVPNTRKLVSFTFHGEEFAPLIPIDLKHQKAIHQFLCDSIRKYEGKIKVKYKVTESGNNLDYEFFHRGQGAITAIKFDDGEATITRCCTQEIVTTWRRLFVDNVAQLGYMGETANLPNNYPFISNDTANAATAVQAEADWKAALESLADLEPMEVSVTVDNQRMGYVVEFKSKSDQSVTVGDSSFEHCGRDTEWVCK